MNSIIIVIPCYNEAHRLNVKAFEEFAQMRGVHERNIEFLFVDSHSEDNTVELVNGLCEQLPDRFQLFQLSENRGKSEAVRRGMMEAFSQSARYAGFWDADLATPLEEIFRFCNVLDEGPQWEIVIGSRVQLLGRQIDRTPLRHLLGRIFATVASIAVRAPVYDTQCGAKVFRVGENIQQIFAEPFGSHWIFDAEILARYRTILKHENIATPQNEPARIWYDAVYELPVNRWRDVPGSKLRTLDFVKSARELFCIWRRYRRPQPLIQISNNKSQITNKLQIQNTK